MLRQQPPYTHQSRNDSADANPNKSDLWAPVQKKHGIGRVHLREKHEKQHCYGCTSSHIRCTVVLHHFGILISSEVGSRERFRHSYIQMLPLPNCQSSSCPWEVLRAPILSFRMFCRIKCSPLPRFLPQSKAETRCVHGMGAVPRPFPSFLGSFPSIRQQFRARGMQGRLPLVPGSGQMLHTFLPAPESLRGRFEPNCRLRRHGCPPLVPIL